MYGRIVFGISAVLFGVMALMWHDADTWQSLVSIWDLPFGTIIGGILMLALIGGGLGIMVRRAVRLASVVLIVVYIAFSLACIPGIIDQSRAYGSYGSFFEQFSLLCGALALYAGSMRRSATLGRLARYGFGLCAVSFTLAQIAYPKITADLVPTWIPPGQMFWAVLTTVAFGLAAIAILINRQTRLALRLLTLMLALFGVLVWIPLLVTHPESHGNWSEFVLTFLITGASWMVASLKTF